MGWTRTEQVKTADGTFAAKVVVPPSGSGPGILVFQEIYGVNDYIEDVCVRLADMGLVAMAPAVLGRMEPGVYITGREPDAMQRGMDFGKRLDFPQAIKDLALALAHLRGLPEVKGKAGCIGFCLGGTLAYMLAAASDVDAAVSYYGSG